MRTVSFKHSGNLGDVIYALPSIKQYCAEHDCKAKLLLFFNVKSKLAKGLSHPSGDVQMTAKGAQMLLPLLLAQGYIVEAETIDASLGSLPEVDFDLDVFRSINCINLAMGNIAHYYMPVLGNSPQEGLAWLDVGDVDVEPGRVVVARSSRYRNPNIDYKSLRGMGVNFIGLECEYKDFVASVPDAKFVKFDNFLDVARFIKSADVLIGNQTFLYSLAEALKVRRVLESCLYANNVIPVGGECFEAYTQQSFDHVLEKYLKPGRQLSPAQLVNCLGNDAGVGGKRIMSKERMYKRQRNLLGYFLLLSILLSALIISYMALH